MSKRLQRELLDNPHTIHKDKDKTYIFKGNIILEFPLDYPFKSPIMKVSGEDLCAFYSFENVVFRNILHKNNNNKCLCCNNIFTNWGPTLYIKDILAEINKVYLLKLNIMIPFIFNKIPLFSY